MTEYRLLGHFELLKACEHCELCYESNGSGPDADGQQDNGYHKVSAQNYLERAILEGGISIKYAGKLSSDCDECHDNGFKSKRIMLAIKPHF